jgi:hypothetical protein
MNAQVSYYKEQRFVYRCSSMQIFIAILLALISIVLFWAWRKRKISNDVLNALAGIFTVIAGIAAITLFIVPSAQPPALDTDAEYLTAVAQATLVGKKSLPIAGIPKCEWLLKNFPQTIEDAATYFDREQGHIKLNYTQCASGAVVDGAIISKPDNWGYVGLFASNGGCLDGVPEEYSTPDPNWKQLDNGHYRVYEGYLLSRDPIIYWGWCDELH